VKFSESDEFFVREHVQYEVTMLIATFAALERGPSSQFELNVLHESFCVHAANMLDWLPCSPSQRIIANKYTDLIEGQVTSLSYSGRTMENKIGVVTSRREIYEFVMHLIKINGWDVD
jgi:hypothetical protein